LIFIQYHFISYFLPRYTLTARETTR